MKNFDFGENWQEFSEKALNSEKISQARNDFNKLFINIPIKGKSFLDIGYGQGLSLLFASEKGAYPVGLEINARCKSVFKKNLNRFFPHLKGAKILIEKGSILDEKTIDNLQKHSGLKEFDVVQSWGVLHHTGNMKKAIINSSFLVDKNGYLILSIYNNHWTSIIWLYIKKIYNISPELFKKFIIIIFYPIVWTAKLIVTKNNPKISSRGMDFYYNLIDWIGGYPYEYASTEEIINIGKSLNLRCLKIFKAQVPTGCNEFIFKKIMKKK